jgi:hypothetical protein
MPFCNNVIIPLADATTKKLKASSNKVTEKHLINLQTSKIGKGASCCVRGIEAGNVDYEEKKKLHCIAITRFRDWV